jgi:hypothetical protein
VGTTSVLHVYVLQCTNQRIANRCQHAHHGVRASVCEPVVLFGCAWQGDCLAASGCCLCTAVHCNLKLSCEGVDAYAWSEALRVCQDCTCGCHGTPVHLCPTPQEAARQCLSIRQGGPHRLYCSCGQLLRKGPRAWDQAAACRRVQGSVVSASLSNCVAQPNHDDMAAFLITRW